MAKKCCTPDLDCTQCRIMSGGWSTKLQPDALDLADAESFSRWLEMVEAVKRIFVYHAAHEFKAMQPDRAVSAAV